MAFFDGFKNKVVKAGQDALGKAKEMADIAKLSSSISDEEKKVNNIYYQIGKLYAQLHESDYEESFSVLFNNLDSSQKKIAELKAKLQELKNVVRCPKCGAEVSADTAFCSACGEKIQEQQAVDTENFVRCPECDTLVQKSMRFCTNCGAKIENQEESSSQEPEETSPVTQENPVEKTCPNCGATLEEDSLFCAECGTKL